ncbi:hypothetical protein [Cupriavidus oxalaticus]|nr:hypothetical protein [Cupriavidus oxalaticus]
MNSSELWARMGILFQECRTTSRTNLVTNTRACLMKMVIAPASTRTGKSPLALYGSWVREIDKEVLLHGRPVPARAVFNESSLRLTLGLTKTARVVQVVGVFFTAYDLTAAAQQSVEIKSARPITKEVMRQAGGWGAAWAGAKIGAAAGATVGIETGPGVIVTGLVGGIIGGSLGYWGADWVVDQME